MNSFDQRWLCTVSSALAILCHHPCLSAPDALSPQSPEASLQSIEVRDGFTVELVAAEPLVMDPISLDWGSDGKLWVVEMADYPSGMDGNGKPGGRVRCLEDTNGDGDYDRSTLFLDGLAYPSSVMAWRKGILVSAAPDVFYVEDSDGNGTPDRRQLLYRGFQPGNPQHRVNGFSWGLDNWLYLANGDSGGTVKSLKTGRTVAIRGRDLRIKPDVGALDPQAGVTQFGRSRDDWGNWFGTSNTQPIMHFVLADHRLRRNPHVAAPPSQVTVASSLNTTLFPISPVISHAADYHVPAPGEPHRFTSACSTIVYRDDLFGEGFANNTFTCEPAHNLVHRRVLQPSNLTFISRRAAGEKTTEFLASTDNWFRPTAVRTGPDGALWIVDFYRQVIEHPEYIDDRLEPSLDLRAGHGKGRIYRVYPTSRQPRPLPRLDRLNSTKLVATLASPNGWQRDRAQQMLIWRGDRSITSELTTMAFHHRRAQARLHALCTLNGLDALTAEALTHCLSDSHPAVRRHAVRLFESLKKHSSAVEAALLQRVNDADPHVRLECAYVLGQWNNAQADSALGRMAVRYADDPYLSAGVMSSVKAENLDRVMAEVFVNADEKQPPERLIRQLLSVAAALGDNAVLVRVFGIIGTSHADDYDAWQLSALGEVLDALDRRGLLLSELSTDPELRSVLDDVASVFEQARRIAVDDNAELTRRELAVKLLGRGLRHRQEDLTTLGRLLGPQAPPEVQFTVVESLGKLADVRVPQILVARWKQHSPRVRHMIFDVLSSRTTWRLALLDDIEDGRIRVADVDASHRHRLLVSDDEAVRKRAQQLFSTSDLDAPREQVVAAYQSVLRAPRNPLQGALVFKSKCTVCHRINDSGHAVGPDLRTLSNPSRESLLTAILDPNRSVDAKYTAYTALTTDGRQFTGILGNETSHSIMLLGLEGKHQTILRTELVSLKETGRSFMPEGMEQDLSRADLADVVAYVMSLAAPSKQYAGNDPQPVTAGNDGCLRLRADNASIHGDTLAFQQEEQCLSHWKNAGNRAVWSLNVTKSGMYAVFMDYAMAPTQTDNRFSLHTASGTLTGSFDSTGGANSYRQSWLGQLYLAQGDPWFTMRAGDGQNTLHLNLRSIWLVPMRGGDPNVLYKAWPGVVPRLVRPTKDGGFQLPVTACEVYGDSARFDPQQNSLSFWSHKKGYVTWTLDVPEAGSYSVFLDYACRRNVAGTSYEITSGKARLSRRILGTGSWEEHRRRLVGSLKLEAGVRRMTFRCMGTSSDCLMDLREISLVRDLENGLLEDAPETIHRLGVSK